MSNQMISEEELQALTAFTGMRDKAKAEVLTGKFRQLFNLQFQLGMLGDDPYGRPYSDMCAQIRNLKAKLKEDQKCGQYIFITINICADWFKQTLATLREGAEVGLDEGGFYYLKKLHRVLERKMTKFQRSKMFRSSVAVIEQRETTRISLDHVYRGQHIHMLVQRNPDYLYSQIDYQVRDRFKLFVGDPKNRSQIHVQQCPVQYVNDKLEYILGVKFGLDASGSPKVEKQKHDIIFRKHFNLQNYYYEEKLPKCDYMYDIIQALEAEAEAGAEKGADSVVTPPTLPSPVDRKTAIAHLVMQAKTAVALNHFCNK